MALSRKYSMTRKKILILGGAGFLGRQIAGRFARDPGYSVTIGDTALPAPGLPVDFSRMNVLDRPAVFYEINLHDVVINCTGQITHPINTCFTINTRGMSNIVEAVSETGKTLVQLSSMMVYGNQARADEQSPLNPVSAYSACKAFAEYQAAELPADRFCILRLPNLYGQGQPKGLFAYLLKEYQSDRKLEFDNNGSLIRYFLHVSDGAEAIYLAVEKKLSGIYNVPAPEKFTLREIIAMIEEIKSMKFEKAFEPVIPAENPGVIDFEAFNKKINFVARIDIRSFIEKSFQNNE